MGNHFAVGDIHGCFQSLETLMNAVGIGCDDTLITLGDYVNRGPAVRQVIDWLIRFDRTNRLVPLRGNHEIMMLSGIDNKSFRDSWLKVGGDATLASYASPKQPCGKVSEIPGEHLDFLRTKLRAFHEIETHFFVHANALPDRPLDEQPDDMLYWERFRDPPRHQSGKVMVCGHTSQKSGLPVTNGNAICIDTRAYGGGWLTCLHVESGKIWQANEQGQHRQFFLGDIP